MICTAVESLWYYDLYCNWIMISPEQIKSSQLSQLVSHATLSGYMHQKEAPNVLKEVG